MECDYALGLPGCLQGVSAMQNKFEIKVLPHPAVAANQDFHNHDLPGLQSGATIYGWDAYAVWRSRIKPLLGTSRYLGSYKSLPRKPGRRAAAQLVEQVISCAGAQPATFKRCTDE
jgi:hypothetical protein